MFSGIVEQVGTVSSVERDGDVLRVRIHSSGDLALSAGASIAVAGCCLTATAADASGFSCELTEETLRRTAFESRLVPGARVNLERPMRADGRFDGHIVQGHVDGVGRVADLRRLGASAELEVEAPEGLARYLVEKGSVAVDGTSLTVAGLRGPAFTVALIPFTLEATTLGQLRTGDPVNLEADVIAKYVERLLLAKDR